MTIGCAEAARKARSRAEAAFFQPSIMSLLYFPAEHQLAIYTVHIRKLLIFLFAVIILGGVCCEDERSCKVWNLYWSQWWFCGYWHKVLELYSPFSSQFSCTCLSLCWRRDLDTSKSGRSTEEAIWNNYEKTVWSYFVTPRIHCHSEFFVLGTLYTWSNTMPGQWSYFSEAWIHPVTQWTLGMAWRFS